MGIGKVIKDFRISQNLSLREFAKKCDISYSNLSKIENGKNKPNNLTLNKIAKTFNIDYLKEKEIDEIDNKYYPTNSNEMVAIYSILEGVLYILNNKATSITEDEKKNIYNLIFSICTKINNFV
ncbi:MAG: helix-turn-helix transcriptional regulator [Clostridium perfringens]|nr:helix-turn-helix transcriptional regulator [Clostridium perfringens]